MKARLLLALLLLASLPRMGWSQSTLNFPKFFSAAELPNAGFAIVNPGSTTASVTFTLYSINGNVVSTSIQTLAGGNQKARSGNEIFSTLGSGGWVQATSSTTGLQGFWLSYAGDLNFIDGTEAAKTALDEVIPLVAGSTELNVANPNGSANTLTIRLFGEAGTELSAAPVTEMVAANGIFQNDVATLFPSVPIANARYLRITGTVALAATAVIRGYLVPKDDAVVNGTDHSSLVMQANFPHVVSGNGGGGNYTTDVGITNLSSAAQTVTISFTPETGGTSLSVTKPLAANGAIRQTALSLFNFNPSVFNNGWIQVTGTAPIAGFVAYADSVAGGIAVVSVQDAPRNQLLFAHIADLAPFYTGLAILNTSSTAANINVYAMTPDGVLIGGADNVPSAKFTLQPNTKTAKLLSELVPQTQARSSDGGFIFVSSNVPIYGIELFFSRNLSALANVPAGSLTSGITYVPPVAPQPLTVSAVLPSTVARGALLTIVGAGFNTTAANNLVIFSTNSGPVSVAATAASSTSLTATVPPTAVSGPVQVQAGGQTTTATNSIIDVVASLNSLVQTPLTVVAGQTVGKMDIYVPTVAAGALNLTVLGVGDPPPSGQALNILTGASSLVIPRGATKFLVVAGTGISAVTVSTVTISGPPDISVSAAPGFQPFFSLADGTPAMIVGVTVSATAVIGPRDVVVRNSDLQTSTMTGGIFIQ